MSFHALYVCRLAHELNSVLQGGTFLQAWSTDKNHLLLQFRGNGGQDLTLSFRVEGPAMYLYFYEDAPAKTGHSLDQFKNAHKLNVKAVVAHPGERSFHIDLGQASLLFLCYGRHANVALIRNDESELFRNRTMDHAVFTPNLLSGRAEGTWPENGHSFLQSSFITPLLRKNFAGTEEDTAYKQMFNAYLTGPVYLNKEEDHYSFDAVEGKQVLAVYPRLSEALFPYSELQLGLYFFERRKAELSRELKTSINSCEKRLKALSMQKEQLETEKNYRHLGDLILSNLPSINEGVTFIDVIDYLDGSSIRIPLREKLSPQDNAQRFYKKAKNQHLQEARLKVEYAQLEEHYRISLEKLEQLESATSMRDLRAFVREKKQKNVQVARLPYHPFRYMEFDILVGKQARDNDELSLKIARKDDLWLHARDVSGSHVVIRKKGNLPFPEPVLMAAAGLALWFSKRRNEALAPVIYTEKKFIRKRKGDAAGAMVVEKEKVVMAAPISPDQL